MLETKIETFTVPAALPPLSTTRRGRTKALACALGIALPVMLLSSFAATKTATLLTGKRVCLNAFVADPRDILRGSYIKLRFETPAAVGFSNGQQVFVTYHQTGANSLWTSTTASAAHPQLKSGEVCIRGTVVQPSFGDCYVEFPFTQVYTSQTDASVQGDTPLRAELAVAASGDAVLTKLINKGRSIGRI